MRTLFWELVAGVTGVLVLATVIGAILGARSGGASATVINLNQRIRAWWAMIAIMVIAISLGNNVTYLVFALLSYLTLREFITLTPTQRGDHLPLVVCFYVLLPVQYWLIAANWYNLFAIFLPVYGFLLLPVLTAFSGDTDHFLERITKIQWGLMITVYCISYAPALLLVQVPQ